MKFRLLDNVNKTVYAHGLALPALPPVGAYLRLSDRKTFVVKSVFMEEGVGFVILGVLPVTLPQRRTADEHL